MSIRARMFSSISALCIVTASAAFAQDPDFDPETSLRIHHYTDPVPRTVPGGVVLDTLGIKQLIDSTDVVLIDVLSISEVRYDELDGSWSGYEPRLNIPGSLWLPNVGYGRPSQDMLKYFLTTVAKATDGELDHPILIYCISDCWMGWNAVQHLAQAGYSKVYWGPLGTDGWVEAGYELELTEPTPVDVDTL